METSTGDARSDVHQPVLVEETLRWLAPRRGIFADCTLGAGGHAMRLLEADSELRLVGIDRDPSALALAAARLAPWRDRIDLVAGRFDRLAERLESLGIDRVDGIFADLGVSSMQLDNPQRGFSFRHSGPLDMRMGSGGASARNLVNELEEEDLYQILREYGEERKARRIARAIVERRAERPIDTTSELAETVATAVGPQRGPRRIHPATRTFQALRIAVNRELDGLDSLLDASLELLNPDGRMVFISYHSLEDRIVKHKLRALAEVEKDQVTGQPLTERRRIEILTRKPVRPSEEEIAANPRSRSAKLRAARRI